ncbi:hypothetical protein A3A76_01425 [Candidatus Woesebacteria bacterium RIFCSPLOWO2_01_FULL_39_23]|uniref:DUF1573 domain-containing protein n=1 Tax=Candidatus Woesebacteria bacterium RIFCSPHIGHO2_01_FULL_40_22 TaxID=1802499 RepID=A0A1F7YIW8_9BACT|nr:MAG: hypothetical protein A2141_04945 [Candidatus Woesebacteria bacterium RBG_16_40_11]OGM26485.1 MAG: hypothetical protein A2628_03020 [Candidatus Woesebacteria bacterium RIFCSPHIGHO2_01_FULL_40_22]OGM37654.1 MAG: hypothetical protein A3E41_05540 [Candidatus Woesebacteria bacterium RIFCSPHIGHO2_12_FULL_38_9]OGM62938.1 MAG: hypothetical protein A3A76_01425 [Candidatus Woesebacteria bacterium RIFCSPLOWO2_01_FULL_39_23]
MRGESKILVAAIIFSVLLIIGFVALSGKSSSEEIKPMGDVSGISVEPSNYNLGDVPIKGGTVTKEYKIKNTTNNTIKLKKLATSCMCTKAKVKIGDKETRLFGMEGMGDKNPSVNLEVAPNEEMLVTAIFDPAAHGPQGVGPFDRSVFLTFSDPSGVRELKFSGKVVS